MRTPQEASNQKNLARLNAADWMIRLLRYNPAYCWWGPGNDYMASITKEGWDSGVEVKDWHEFAEEKGWGLDELNVPASFHFDVVRASQTCPACDRSGYNPAVKRIADAFYEGERWCDKITDDEVAALIREGRLMPFIHTLTEDKGWVRREDGYIPTAAEFNLAQQGSILDRHDTINCRILVEARARRLGCWGPCPECDGHGYVSTESAAHVELTLWWLHPRKGASRGVTVKSIGEQDVVNVLAWLRSARDHLIVSQWGNLDAEGTQP